MKRNYLPFQQVIPYKEELKKKYIHEKVHRLNIQVRENLLVCNTVIKTQGCSAIEGPLQCRCVSGIHLSRLFHHFSFAKTTICR